MNAKKRIHALLVLTLISLAIPCEVEARSVVLFIGDGMGPAAITATRIANEQAAGRGLFMDSMQLAAHVKTSSADRIVTDSAAAATAMATGVKTENGCLGLAMPCSKGNALQTIAEEAARAGLSVGLVTTTRITHATPAGFYAHVANRNDEAAIAKQLLSSDVDVALGGGCKYLTPEIAAASDHAIVRDMKSLAAIEPGKKVVGCFADSHIPYVKKRKSEKYGGPSLPEMTAAAIARLSKNPKGYFLMVEGGRIDHAAHDNLAADVIAETAEFDDAIRRASGILKGDAVILVTADHETGGIAVNGYAPKGTPIFGDAGEDVDGKPYPMLGWATGPASKYPRLPDKDDPRHTEGAHTAVDVLLFSAGLPLPLPGGTIENTEIYRIAKDALFNLK